MVFKNDIPNDISLLRPSGKFLVLQEDTEESRFLIGRELMMLMGIPVHRMVGIEDTPEKVFWFI